MPHLKVVAISGSLRARSSNSAVLRAATAAAPPDLEVVLYEGLGELPHFNPDLDGEAATAPAPVAALRALLAGADGLIISSPEYAHGVPGALKNALDWLVSDPVIIGLPVLLINASPAGGQYAQAALLETLSVMSMNVLAEASLVAPFLRKRLDPDGGVDPDGAQALAASVAALAEAARARRQRPSEEP